MKELFPALNCPRIATSDWRILFEERLADVDPTLQRGDMERITGFTDTGKQFPCQQGLVVHDVRHKKTPNRTFLIGVISPAAVAVNSITSL